VSAVASIDSVRIVIIGGGIAGASTAAALARAGLGPGVILEREAIPGAHASGKNAGIACVAEFDPVVRQLSVAGVKRLHEMSRSGGLPVIRPCSGLYLGDGTLREEFETCVIELAALQARAQVMTIAAARQRFPFLSQFAAEVVLESQDEGVIDIHALLLSYLEEARRGRFSLLTRTEALDLATADGRVVGVVTPRGTILADLVVDAAGAWAGRLVRQPGFTLQPVRRHLFISPALGPIPASAPVVWHVSDGYYLRPDGLGLLLSPCDESPQEPGEPHVDPGAAATLAAKLSASAPSLSELPIHSSWACLRTFAPDRRPVIGPDPNFRGLFHVSGLGGFGMGVSWAVGAVAAALIAGEPVPFIDPATVSPERLASQASAVTDQLSTTSNQR